jgi:hypothetical protein
VHVSDLHFDDEHAYSSLPTKNVPTELEALILLASKKYKEFPWKVIDSDDEVKTDSAASGYFLSRTSYFHQIRNLVYDIEVKLNGVPGEVKHPKTGKSVDLQVVYSEEYLDWIFNKYGKLADMSSLEKMILPPVAVASPTPVIVAPVTPVVTLPSPTITSVTNATNSVSSHEKKGSSSPKVIAVPIVVNDKDLFSKIKSDLLEAESEDEKVEGNFSARNNAPKVVDHKKHESPAKRDKSPEPSSPGEEYGGDFEDEEDDQPSVGAKTLDEKQVDNLSNYFADLLNDDDDCELPADFYFA